MLLKSRTMEESAVRGRIVQGLVPVQEEPAYPLALDLAWKVPE